MFGTWSGPSGQEFDDLYKSSDEGIGRLMAIAFNPQLLKEKRGRGSVDFW